MTQLSWKVDWENTFWTAVFRHRTKPDQRFPAETLAAITQLQLPEKGWNATTPLQLQIAVKEAHVSVPAPAHELADSWQPELELRRDSAKREWLAYGPGWLFAFQQRLDRSEMPLAPILQANTVSLHVVLPFGGPFCIPTLDDNSLGWLGVVLYNVHPVLPEWMRAAWLIARRQIANSQNVSNQEIDGLATLATLATASELDMVSLDAQSFEMAHELWCPTAATPNAGDSTAIDWNAVTSLKDARLWLN